MLNSFFTFSPSDFEPPPRKYHVPTIAATITTAAGQRPTDNFIKIKNATKKGYLEATDGDGIDLSQPNSTTRRGRVQKEKRQTITTQNNLGVCLKTQNKRIIKLVKNTNLDCNEKYLDIYNQKAINNISGTLKSGMDNQQGNIIYDTLRIRKLTPKECWRLMGFDDEDYEKASKVCSNTQLYKQAGNSIVVNVLEEIIKQLL